MLDAVKEQRTDCSQNLFPSGARAAKREMFADMLGFPMNSLVRYIPVNQVGLRDLRCREMDYIESI